eukprot:1670562-Amphidinium_carterae.1
MSGQCNSWQHVKRDDALHRVIECPTTPICQAQVDSTSSSSGLLASVSHTKGMLQHSKAIWQGNADTVCAQ